ncbi:MULTISPECIES: ABC transporter ATP-binding protein [Cytobacillus]|uniref:ABC transporter ATP-binding protein n=2 Tax=Cytobacillus TaxID=2675230 RepID=A0A169FTI2_9BACI|nr:MULTISPECIES: ABC transporter ATP-binding protein [Cytobacillus]EFV76946.1 ABC transporter-like protein [Bacillus sp. 2_A_57_CT2]MCS0824232.1 ABC transporter ATP-binding protein [Cytobacillus firmus]AND40921.1 ABC transporter ATP-binding protein [Cytobacillus oceanisediminis 2691]MBU8729434.1 ABC transporter ATP-binding protein [Cytobacillus oceanisediminis]MBU8769856.1 ABC transporter ATP-binding protein [Cytobacillus oceanisediminis]
MGILEIKDATLRFGGVVALDNVSYEVQEGEIFSLIGPNGAGKTSMLNCISGLYKPSSGSIHFKGEDITRYKPHKRASMGIARAFQNIELFPHLSVLDNLMLGRHVRMKTGLLAGGFYWGKAQREEIEHRKKVEQVIDFLEIEDIRNTPVGTLSYGLQKRVETGRALALEPDILLLDEPMAGMNSEEKEDMARYIIDIHEEMNTTIILIEHDMGVVMDLSDHIAVLDFGKLIGYGTPEEIQNNPRVIEAYLGEENAV